MSETRTILEDSANGLLSEFADPAVIRRIEEGGTPDAAWGRIAEMGLEQIFAGASDDPWRDAAVVLKAAGRHATPAPLAETLMAGALLAGAGLEMPEGPLAIASPQDSAVRIDDGGRLTGVARRVAWGRHARHVVVEADGAMLALVPVAAARLEEDRSVSREPRDTLTFENVAALGFAPVRAGATIQHGALMRAAQMAGAVEATLDLTVQYARERSQFGKPIGSFQAIQHQLAILARHSAAASRSVDAGFERIAEGGEAGFEAAVSKIRTGEAASAACSIAQQTHGAIGFTDEHRLHYLTRRLWSWRAEFGSAAFWSGQLGRRIAAFGADEFWPTVTAAG